MDAALRDKATTVTISGTLGRGTPWIEGGTGIQRGNLRALCNDVEGCRESESLTGADGREGHRHQQFSMRTPLREGVGALDVILPTQRWVDHCRSTSASNMSDSYSSASSQSGGSAEDAPTPSASSSRSSSAADLRCLLENDTPHRLSAISGAAEYYYNKNDGYKIHSHRILQHARPPPVQRARRLPLPAGRRPPAPAQQQQVYAPSSGNNGSAAFACFVLLHGCLCEAPLAVIEGVLRGPFYLVAAAWVALVGRVGASRLEHRAKMWKQAAALAREGVLLLVASLTLAIPFSTSFTVYRDFDADDAWDVRPIPTVLGAVDPLRFFVFAFGQAGELAANGKPREQPHGVVVSSPSLSMPPSSPLSAAKDVEYDEEETLEDTRNNAARIFGIAGGEEGPTAATGCANYRTTFRTHSSLDADRLGVGMLHPPQKFGPAASRVGVRTRRTAVSAYRKIAASVRRLQSGSHSAVVV